MSLKGGASSVGTVALFGGVAPTGGQVVQLLSTQSVYVTVPPSVTIEAGARQATFTILTKPIVNSPVFVDIVITAKLNATQQSARLTIFPQ